MNFTPSTSRTSETLYLSAPAVVELVRRQGLRACLQGIADNIRTNVVEVSGGSISTQSGEILLRVSERRDFANQFAALPIVSPVAGTPLDRRADGALHVWPGFRGKSTAAG